MSGNGGRWSDIMDAPDPGDPQAVWVRLRAQSTWVQWTIEEPEAFDEEPV